MDVRVSSPPALGGASSSESSSESPSAQRFVHAHHPPDAPAASAASSDSRMFLSDAAFGTAAGDFGSGSAVVVAAAPAPRSSSRNAPGGGAATRRARPRRGRDTELLSPPSRADAATRGARGGPKTFRIRSPEVTSPGGTDARRPSVSRTRRARGAGLARAATATPLATDAPPPADISARRAVRAREAPVSLNPAAWRQSAPNGAKKPTPGAASWPRTRREFRRCARTPFSRAESSMRTIDHRCCLGSSFPGTRRRQSRSARTVVTRLAHQHVQHVF